eukprot:478443-Rhodomonas_salina.5
MQCPLLTSANAATSLRACYATTGTDLRVCSYQSRRAQCWALGIASPYAATRPIHDVRCGTGIAYGVLPCYGMSGIELVYGSVALATRTRCDVRYHTELR